MATPQITTLAHELQDCINQFHRDSGRVKDLVAPLDDKLLNRRPSQKRWSVAECIEHLIVSGDLGRINKEKAIETGRANGRTGQPPFRYGFIMRKMIGIAGNYPPTFKVPTVSKFEPQKKTFTADELISRFESLQQDLVEAARRANGLDLAKIKVTSPISSLLKIPLGLYFQLVVGHQNRHLGQARDALRAAGS